MGECHQGGGREARRRAAQALAAMIVMAAMMIVVMIVAHLKMMIAMAAMIMRTGPGGGWGKSNRRCEQRRGEEFLQHDHLHTPRDPDWSPDVATMAPRA